MKRFMTLLVGLLVLLVASVAVASPLKMSTPDSNSTWLESPVIIGSTSTMNTPGVVAHNLIVPKPITVATVYVRGYTRSNGTYVAPHTRSDPDGNPYNNYGY